MKDRVNEHYYGDPAAAQTVRCRERVHWLCRHARGQRVLDIGCSQGITCLALAREGFVCEGVDVDPAALDYFKNALAKEPDVVRARVQIHLADATQLPFGDRLFDTVILGEILEHLTQPERVLEEARRVLREGGRVVITVPHGLNAFADHKRFYYPLSLLRTTLPYFKAEAVTPLEGYVGYCGVKMESYDPARMSAQELLGWYEEFDRQLEERCLAMEQRLLETSTKAYAQSKEQSQKIAALGETIGERDAALPATVRDTEALRAESRAKLAAHEKEHVEVAEAKEREVGRRLAKMQAGVSKALGATNAALEELQSRLSRELAVNARMVADALAQIERERAQQQEALARALDESQARMLTVQREHGAEMARILAGQAELLAAIANRGSARGPLAPPATPGTDTARDLQRRIQEAVHASVPADATVVVISKGDDDLLELGGRRGWHFPQTPEGVYAGYHPANSSDAIAHLEELRAKGGGFLLIPAPAFWWLDFYADFRRHIESLYHLLMYREETCAIFALSPPPPGRTLQIGLSLRPVERKAASIQANPPSVMTPGPGRVTRVAEGRPEGAHRALPSGRLVVAGVLDEFTAACFRPECTLVTFRPDNWKDVLERNPPNLLLVESAWQGNGGSWQYKIASFKKPMGEELVDLVSWCKARGVPTVFWNKEDPPHFDRFIHRAPLFDCVFTSDGDMVPRYRDAVKHDRVFALPFAAQPLIHNPILEAARNYNVCFAGAYYAFDHDERRADIDLILRPALKFGLHIYDRQHGVAGANAKAYQFPALYQPAIKGRLEYDEMVKAYKLYKVFLNVNSVKGSPTMFSRRVFELLASGTPVVSAYARGIVELLGSKLVHITRSEEDTAAHLRRLLRDADYWADVSARGIREVLSRHTYSHRMSDICQAAGLPVPEAARPTVEAIAAVSDKESLRRLTSSVKRQAFAVAGLTVVLSKGVKARDLQAVRRALPGIRVREGLTSADAVVRAALEIADGWVWLLNPHDYYGENFLKDAALATVYSDADVIGKHTHFEMAKGRSRLQLNHAGHDFRLVKSLSPGSMLARARTLDVDQWRALAANRTITMPGLRMLSIDRFNYVRHGGESESKALKKALV